jgi:hypothetical protein
MDEDGWIYLETPLGFGLVHTQDMGQVAEAVELGLWTVKPVLRAELPATYSFVLSPAQQHATAGTTN